MNGQWLGAYTGANSGFAMVDIDDMGDHYEGEAYFINSNALPTVYAMFITQDKSASFRIVKQPIFPVDPKSHLIDSWDNVKKHYNENVSFSKFVDVEGNFDGTNISLKWKSEHELEGSGKLSKSKAQEKSDYVSLDLDWNGYKEFIANLKLEPQKFIFRGQNETWRLQTKFHRTGRARLKRFLNEDRTELYRNLSARTKHIFNLSNPDENGAFLNLVQHHGYPTPLLDWTYSPYVAAFFAYRNVNKTLVSSNPASDKVRIFVFDIAKWESNVPKSVILDPPFPNLAIMKFIAIDNERMLPQQAVSTMTNMDDIEAFVNFWEKRNNTKYLQVVDLPKQERQKVMTELSYMGITASSLFPGMDGACEALRERFF